MSTHFDHAFTPDASRYPFWFDSESERTMRAGFIAAAQAVVAREADYRKRGDSLLAGMELEFPLIRPNYTLVQQSIRDAVIAAFQGVTSVELAAHQLEVISPEPVDLLAGLRGLESGLQRALDPIFALLQQLDSRLVRIGAYPLVALDQVPHTMGDPKYAKYERSPRWHMDHQRRDAIKTISTVRGLLDISNAYAIGVMNAVQLTIDAVSFDDAIDKLNRAWMIAPFATALGANAAYLDCTPTGYADVRFHVWEVSHDSRVAREVLESRPTRVGLPRRYCTGLGDYFNRILSYPFVMNDPIALEHPFEVGNGIYWRDARLKFFREIGTIGVEFRPVALQPSLHEDVAMMLFFVGRLLWSQAVHEDLLDMAWVIGNKKQAMLYGLDAQFTLQGDHRTIKLPVREQLRTEIDRAVHGLQLLGASYAEALYYMECLYDRLTTGSPAQVFTARVDALRGVPAAQGTAMTDRRALIAAMEELGLVLPN